MRQAQTGRVRVRMKPKGKAKEGRKESSDFVETGEEDSNARCTGPDISRSESIREMERYLSLLEHALRQSRELDHTDPRLMEIKKRISELGNECKDAQTPNPDHDPQIQYFNNAHNLIINGGSFGLSQTVIKSDNDNNNILLQIKQLNHQLQRFQYIQVAIFFGLRVTSNAHQTVKLEWNLFLLTSRTELCQYINGNSPSLATHGVTSV